MLERFGEMSKRFSDDQKKLIRRYLVWCFKTTREEIDRIDRKFTQLKIDEEIRKELLREGKSTPPALKQAFAEHVRKFDEYIEKKREEALTQKYSDAGQKKLQPSYLYLQARLKAIQNSIHRHLGAKGLADVKGAYEAEMTRRIWEAREHT